ncbi:MAG: 50S ribosomal protein L17 [Candidatus Magnetoovum sp. WYHC-5]|nr:50S ribosomal protein L17 [Candidatus Magnetoovum sp. WYHC-5]
MRHKVATKLFNRTANQRKALFRNLIAALIEYERIETTITKAKVLRTLAERIVTLSKRGDLHAKRLAMSKIPNRKVVAKLFRDIAPRFIDRNGGYLRIVKTRRRLKDQAEMAVVEFIDFKKEDNEKKDAKKTNK